MVIHTHDVALPMMRQSKRILGTAALLGGVMSCATYTSKMAEMREAFVVGDYDRASEALERSGLKDNSSDTLLWQLEGAMIYDRQGQYEKSRKFFLDADRTVDELFTVSVSKTASTFIVNESTADYEGEDYEKVAIHTMLAHQFIGLGKVSEAAVQARKINNKLYEINQKYDPESRNKYGEDAHARYLSALIYESRGECDSAIIDYTKALKLYKDEFSRYVKDGLPKGVVRGLARCATIRQRKEVLSKLMEDHKASLGNKSVRELVDHGQLVVIHELGHIAPKEKAEFFFGAGQQMVRFSFPTISPGAIYDQGTGVHIERLGFFDAENTAYLDAIAADALEDRRGRLMVKQAARLLVKGQLNYQAERNFGPLGGLAANLVTAATETADTRSWTTLPKAFFVTRVFLPAGVYQIKVKSNGKINHAKSLTVRQGQVVMMRGIG
jgi:hypothetical protein